MRVLWYSIMLLTNYDELLIINDRKHIFTDLMALSEMAYKVW